MILKQRPMASVGIGQQHRSRQVFAQHIGISDRNHVVEDPVHHETRLPDLAELPEPFPTDAFPRAKRRRLTRLTRSEEELHQYLQSLEVWILENLLELRLLQVHDVLAAFGGRADQEHLPDEGRTVERDLLCHHTAKGKTQQIHLRET